METVKQRLRNLLAWKKFPPFPVRLDTHTYQGILVLSSALNVLLLLEAVCQNWSPVAVDLLTGSLVSFIFYYIVVYVPDKLRRNALKRTFLQFYKNFRRDILVEVLVLAEFKGDILGKADELSDVKKFAAYCHEASLRPGQENWHVLMNNLTVKKYAKQIENIVIKISELQREVDFLVRSSGVSDEELLRKFRQFDRALQDGRYLKDMDPNYEEDVRFSNALHELLSGWSYVTGTYDDFLNRWVKQL